MTSIHAKVVSTEKYGDPYRFIIELLPSEFKGPFETLRFKKNPYSGSFGTSLTKSWLTLDYRKDPGFKPGEAFPLRRTDQNVEAWLQKRFDKKPHYYENQIRHRPG